MCILYIKIFVNEHIAYEDIKIFKLYKKYNNNKIFENYENAILLLCTFLLFFYLVETIVSHIYRLFFHNV